MSGFNLSQFYINLGITKEDAEETPGGSHSAQQEYFT